MSVTYRPRTQAERDSVIAAVDAYIASADADPELVALDTRFFSTARAAYSAALETHQSLSAAAREASDAADSADADFDRDLRLFVATVRDRAGHLATSSVTELLGGILPSVLSKSRYREEVTKAQGLLMGLPKRPSLGYDATRADALRNSTDALDTAATADELATRDARKAGVALTSARTTFDQSYAKLVRMASGLLSDEVLRAILPRFVRSDATPAAPTATTTTTT